MTEIDKIRNVYLSGGQWTYAQIAEKTGVRYRTAQEVGRRLMGWGAIVRVNKGINPAVTTLRNPDNMVAPKRSEKEKRNKNETITEFALRKQPTLAKVWA